MTSKFKIGERVIFTNSNGVVFKDKIVTGIEKVKNGFKYFYSPTNAPWFPVPESSLKSTFEIEFCAFKTA
jgi:hypothetical protein